MVLKSSYVIIFLLMVTSAIAIDGTMTNMRCQTNPNFNIGEKEYCLATIPSNYTNQSFKCISYIEKDGKIIQTNPEYVEKSGGFLGMFSTETELRENFVPANSIVNFYYTAKNMHKAENYTLFISCNSQSTRLTSNKTITMNYENLDFVFARTDWAMRNIPYLIAGSIMLFLLIFTIFWIVRVSL